MTVPPEEFKAHRLASGKPPRVLELCSGAGGMALGFLAAGFELSAHVETSPEANVTYARNLLGVTDPEDQRAAPTDMLTTSIAELRRAFGIVDDDQSAFDVLVAGLPCQAFARVGRSKLSSVAGIEDAYKVDPRASLYRRFLEIVQEVHPLVVVLENVPDILNFGGHNVPEEISKTLSTMGYKTSYSVLNSAYFGVPQFRERLFLIAFHSVLGTRPQMPVPTHFATLPKGYVSSRNVAMKYVSSESQFFSGIVSPASSATPSITAREAIADLPVISYHLTSVKPTRTAPDQVIRYPKREQSSYAAKMRSWSGFESPVGTDGHSIRLTPRDYETFRRMSEGDDYPSALRAAREILNERMAKLQRAPEVGSEEYQSMAAAIVPPYDASKFPNKWWKLQASAPVRTLTAHLGKDTYSHIHYDASQSRMISVREAARLQSFPDGYRFGKSINAALRQIGNAVPPLLAEAVAGSILTNMRNALDIRMSDSAAA